MYSRVNGRRRPALDSVYVLGIAAALAFTASAAAQQADQAAAPGQARAALPAQAQVPAPVVVKPPPFPNRFNDVVPSWLRVRGEFRDRMEGPDGIGFVNDRKDLYWVNRFRFDVTVRPSSRFAVQAQLQDARVEKKDVGVTTGPPFRDALDLRTAFADIGNTEKGPFTVRVGRQELAFGEQRLVGHLNWANTARTFDAVRATFRTKVFRVDGFASSVVRIQDGVFDKSGNGNRFFGAYGSTTSLIPKGTLEPYLFWRGYRGLKAEGGDIGDLAVATIGARVVGKLPARLDYGTEMAIQTGSLGSDSVRAWAGHWVLGDTLGGPLKIRIAQEYNFATGDGNPTDGRRQTFDQLYPTGHDKFGLADLVGWKNTHDLRSTIELTPHRGWPLTGSYHSWWLADTRDALYSASGATVARVAGGGVNAHVGQEVDAQVTRAINPQVQVAGGYAYVFPGQFLKTATPGASYSYPFVMVTYVFLADR